MFRHGDDLYLVARRDLGGPYDGGLSSLSFGDHVQGLAVDVHGGAGPVVVGSVDVPERSIEQVARPVVVQA